MATIESAAPPSSSKAAVWAGRVLSSLAAAFMLLDGVMKLAKPSFVVEKTIELGFVEQVIVPLGAVLTFCTILYIVPRTAVLGAIFLTGYLGGAVAMHVLKRDGAFGVMFPVIFGALIWGGLVLRNRELRTLVFGGRVVSKHPPVSDLM